MHQTGGNTVVSLAAENADGYPHGVALKFVAAAKLLLKRTDRDGTITSRSFGQTFEVIETKRRGDGAGEGTRRDRSRSGSGWT